LRQTATVGVPTRPVGTAAEAEAEGDVEAEGDIEADDVTAEPADERPAIFELGSGRAEAVMDAQLRR
jgi:hypothetical protein